MKKKRLNILIFRFLFLIGICSTLILVYIITSNQWKIDGIISDEMRDNMIKNAKGSGSLLVKTGTATTLDAEDYSINMHDFLVLLDTIKHRRNNLGLRIYPAHGTENEQINVSYILAIDSVENPIKPIYKKRYILLDQDYKTQNTIIAKLTERSFVEKYFIDFYKNVSVNVLTMTSDHSPSRFYSADDLISFLYSYGIMYDHPDDYDNYRIVIAGGVINDLVLSDIKKYNSHEMHCTDGKCELGITCIIRINKTGLFGVIWSDFGRSYEIGNPCPPNCGELMNK